jgi:hypothetical protein
MLKVILWSLADIRPVIPKQGSAELIRGFAINREINVLKYRIKIPNIPRNIGGIFIRPLAILE